MKLTRWALLAATVAFSLSCNRNDDDDDDGPSVNPLGPESYAIAGSTPPVVITFNIAFAENVPLSALQAIATKFETANDSLWEVTEGQMRIGKLRITDNAHPGSKSHEYNQLNLTANDIVVWSPQDFAGGPGIAYVLVGSGRFGRFMGIPSNVANTTILHELGHFLFELSWGPAPVLIDEYEEDPDDPACLMELQYALPLRWCSESNHLTQLGQPHSCWTQILLDYPAFRYMGQNQAPTTVIPPMIEFTDNP